MTHSQRANSTTTLFINTHSKTSEAWSQNQCRIVALSFFYPDVSFSSHSSAFFTGVERWRPQERRRGNMADVALTHQATGLPVVPACSPCITSHWSACRCPVTHLYLTLCVLGMRGDGWNLTSHLRMPSSWNPQTLRDNALAANDNTEGKQRATLRAKSSAQC